MLIENTAIDTGLPYWQDYRELLNQLTGDSFPDPWVLNRLLQADSVNESGRAIRFVPACQLPGVAYEKHIHETGEVSTRESSWHDLFNALVWCRLPRLKSAMNAIHFQNLGAEETGQRGRLRDALTLLDESGVIVVSGNEQILDALAKRNWDQVFVECGTHWGATLRVIVCGHALLEKFLNPYKSITAHALLLKMADTSSIQNIDEVLANRLVKNKLFSSPVGLSPLPLMGIPGWWNDGAQDADFYADRAVFRLPSKEFTAAPVFNA